METNQFNSTVYGNHEFVNCAEASIGRRFGGGAVDIFFTFSMAYLIPILGPLLSVAYYLNKDALPFLDGQSLGKKLFQIRVVKISCTDSTTKNYTASILRSVTILIPVLNVIEVVMLLSNKERFGDKWAETLVIKV